MTVTDEDMSDIERATVDIEARRIAAAQAERDAVVKWLRSDKIVLSMDGSAEDVVASAIEAGEHLK